MMSKIHFKTFLAWLLFSLYIQPILAQDLDIINLEFARSLYKEQISFIDKINDSITIAASQKNAYLFNNANIIIDTLSKVRYQNQNSLIQEIEVLGDDIVFVGTMKNLMLFQLQNEQVINLKDIAYNKSFPPWKDKHQLRFLTKNGFLGISIPLSKKTVFEVSYYSEKENYKSKTLLYEDTQSDYSVFSRSQWSKNIEFIDDIILINDFYRSKTIFFDPSKNTTKIIELYKPDNFNYSFLSYDKKIKQYYLLSKDQNGNTEIRKFNVNNQKVSDEKWSFDHNIFSISNDNIWYKKIVDPDRILGLFSLPFDEKTKENITILDEVIVNDNK